MHGVNEVRSMTDDQIGTHWEAVSNLQENASGHLVTFDN